MLHKAYNIGYIQSLAYTYVFSYARHARPKQGSSGAFKTNVHVLPNQELICRYKINLATCISAYETSSYYIADAKVTKFISNFTRRNVEEHSFAVSICFNKTVYWSYCFILYKMDMNVAT